MGNGKPFFVLKSFANEVRLYEDHLEGEFFGQDLVEAFGKRFYSLKYSAVERVVITETADRQVVILEIDFDGKPEFEKKHLHPSNLFFRKSRKDKVQECLGVKALIEYLKENPFDEAKAMQVLYPGKDNESKLKAIPRRISKLKSKLLFFFNF